MTRPGTQLLWTAEGVHHAHTEEEAAAGLWRPGGECEFCPHKDPPWVTVEWPEETKVERKTGGEE